MTEKKQEEQREEEKEKNSVPQNSIARMFLKDEEFKEEQKIHEKKKSLSDMTRKEKRLFEKEKIKGMGFQKRMEYFIMYYKWVPILILALIFAAVGGYDWYQSARIEYVLTFAPVNTIAQDFEQQEQEIRKTLGAEGKYEEVSIRSGLITDSTGTDLNYHSQMAFMTQMQAGDIDVVLMPEQVYHTMKKKGILENMEDVLGKEGYQSFEGQEEKECIVLTDPELKEKFGLVYDDIYIGVLKTSLHLENAAEWIMSLK